MGAPNAEPTSDKPLPTKGRFDGLALGVAFAVTGAIVYYLPSLRVVPFNWQPAATIGALVLTVVGTAGVLIELRQLTTFETFSDWSLALVTSAVAVGTFVLAHTFGYDEWLMGPLTLLGVGVTLFSMYGYFVGISHLDRDRRQGKPLLSMGEPNLTVTQAIGSSEQHDTTSHGRFGWYELTSLAVAVVACVATVLATAVAILK